MQHIHLTECHSTQDVVKEQLSMSPQSSHLVSCDEQTQGRGRGQNSWNSLPGTLCFSMNIKPHIIQSFTALEVSVLVSRFIETKGINLLLKWPNDLWDKNFLKCCGVLIQSSQEQMIAGIGLNLFSSSHDFGGVFETEFPLSKKEWCLDIATFIHENRYTETQILIQDWEKRCFHLNQLVVIKEGEDNVEGIFRGLGPHGEALLDIKKEILHLYNGSLRPSSLRS